ncbi:MAG: FlgD immunoglobulin-like domain containing protein [Bacteroidales bacterium]|nr:FlgD immunoglobulin-like domain containing protein [Bacteroidales bacterium]
MNTTIFTLKKVKSIIKTTVCLFQIFLISNCFCQTFFNIIKIADLPQEAYIMEWWTEDSCLLSCDLYIGDSSNIRVYPDSVFNVSDATGEDLFNKHIWVPDENLGCLPYDVCYNTIYEKYYLYGGRKIIIIDAQTNNIIQDYVIAETTDVTRIDAFKYLGIEERLLFLESSNRIFCADDDGKLLVIHGEEDTIISDAGSGSVSPYQIFTSLHYNSNIHKVFWVRSDYGGGCFISYIRVFNDDGEYKTDIPIQGERITDISSNGLGNRIYVTTTTSGGGGKIRTYSFTNNTLQVIKEKSVNYAPQTIVFIPQNGSNPESFWVGYCDSDTIKIFDGCSGDMQGEGIYNPHFLLSILGYYNQEVNKVYYTGIDKVEDHGVEYLREVIIEIDPQSLAIDYKYINNILGPAYVNIDGSSNFIYTGSTNRCQVIETSDFTVSGSSELSGCHSYRLSHGIISDLPHIFSANYLDGNCSIIDISEPNNPTNEHLAYAGGAITKGCYNNKDDKLYFIQDGAQDYLFSTFNDSSFIAIIDGESDENLEFIPIGNNLMSLCYNYYSNRIFVSSYNDDKLIVINGSSNQIETTLEIDYPGLLHSGSDKNIFCVGDVDMCIGIYIINASTYNYKAIKIPMAGGEINDMIFDGDHILYFCYGRETGFVMAIDLITNEFSNPLEVHPNPVSLEYDPVNKILFCINYTLPSDNNFLNIISINSWNNYSINNVPIGVPSFDMVFRSNNHNRKIYILGVNKLSIYDIDHSLLSQKYVYGQSLLYNPYNDRVYVNLDYFPDNQGKIIVYDCQTDAICSEIPLMQKKINEPYTLTRRNPFQLVLNSTWNKLYCGNRAFSNVSVIDCSNETKVLRPGWTWLSFPRLDREGNEPVQAVDLLTGHIVPDNFTNGQMRNLPLQTSNEIYIEYLIDPYPHWTAAYGGLNQVISTLGYKVYTGPEEERWIDVTGTIIDRQTDISIYAGYKNWIGYFQEEPQDVFNALPEDVLDELTLIQAQDWACVKKYYWPPPPYPQGGPPVPVWMCLQGDPLQYGDMVILKTNSDLTFQWNSTGIRPKHISQQNTEYFIFEEKADYVPLYIELDSTDNPDEIGAFINDSCVGACVVENKDTLVMIRGYFGEGQNEEITFEEFYDSLKSVPVRKNEYYVYNPQSLLHEKRMIKTGENHDWYLISFTPRQNPHKTINESGVRSHPNPFMQTCLIEYTVTTESDVQIDVYDLFGRVINTLVRGHHLPGSYFLQWDGSNQNGMLMPEGVYLLMMTAGSQRNAAKIILTR